MQAMRNPSDTTAAFTSVLNAELCPARRCQHHRPGTRLAEADACRLPRRCLPWSAPGTGSAGAGVDGAAGMRDDARPPASHCLLVGFGAERGAEVGRSAPATWPQWCQGANVRWIGVRERDTLATPRCLTFGGCPQNCPKGDAGSECRRDVATAVAIAANLQESSCHRFDRRDEGESADPVWKRLFRFSRCCRRRRRRFSRCCRRRRRRHRRRRRRSRCRCR